MRVNTARSKILRRRRRDSHISPKISRVLFSTLRLIASIKLQMGGSMQMVGSMHGPPFHTTLCPHLLCSRVAMIRIPMDAFSKCIDGAARFAKDVLVRGSPSDEYQPSPQNKRMVVFHPRAHNNLPMAAIIPGDGVLEQVIASGQEAQSHPFARISPHPTFDVFFQGLSTPSTFTMPPSPFD